MKKGDVLAVAQVAGIIGAKRTPDIIPMCHPIMIDGTGMCGCCRLSLNQDGKRITKFACVDGPDFNGYEVDFDEAMTRGRMYTVFERKAYEETCNLFKAKET